MQFPTCFGLGANEKTKNQSLHGRVSRLDMDGARLSPLNLFSFIRVPVFSGEAGGREVLTYDFLTHFPPFHSAQSLPLRVVHTAHTNSCPRKLSDAHKFCLTVEL